MAVFCKQVEVLLQPAANIAFLRHTTGVFNEVLNLAKNIHALHFYKREKFMQTIGTKGLEVNFVSDHVETTHLKRF